MRIAPLLVGAFYALSDPAAAAVTLEELDPLTRGICEQLEITAQCPVPEAAPEREPKGPKVIRPKPRPGWCRTRHAWRFPRCLARSPLEVIYGSAPATGIVYYGPGRGAAAASARASSSSLAWLGGGGGGSDDRRSDVRKGDWFVTVFEEHHHHAGCPCGCCELPAQLPEPPTPIPLLGTMPVFLTALAALAALKRRFRRG